MTRSSSQLLAVLATAVLAGTAVAACGGSSHNSHGSTTASTTGHHMSYAQAMRLADRFATCMRSHGVPNFPDPASPKSFKVSLDPSANANLRSPAGQRAATACEQLLPGGAPHTQSPAHTRAQVAGLLAFARCLRTHGFPRFPDPTSSGQLTHQMVASAGIDLQQPAVLRTGDACASVTHGIITKAMVAQFVAGH